LQQNNKKMTVYPVITQDGSITFKAEEQGEHYHSVNGAITESEYVFIENGLKAHSGKNVSVFEVGFGTGLNAFLTMVHASELKTSVHYSAIELFPLEKSQYDLLNYHEFYPKEFNSYLRLINDAAWGESLKITDSFFLQKINSGLHNHSFEKNSYDIVYFDAFSPQAQPEMWTMEVFRKIFDSMKDSGILVTYSASGNVRRSMEYAGFSIEKLNGPPGKRHMLRGRKNS
jgi:tRNA U34 5-methylaminomethyl-2-thiouridine-forming methyltransferase MnmC